VTCKERERAEWSARYHKENFGTVLVADAVMLTVVVAVSVSVDVTGENVVETAVAITVEVWVIVKYTDVGSVTQFVIVSPSTTVTVTTSVSPMTSVVLVVTTVESVSKLVSVVKAVDVVRSVSVVVLVSVTVVWRWLTFVTINSWIVAAFVIVANGAVCVLHKVVWTGSRSVTVFVTVRVEMMVTVDVEPLWAPPVKQRAAWVSSFPFLHWHLSS
jgi:hypothetical protein